MKEEGIRRRVSRFIISRREGVMEDPLAGRDRGDRVLPLRTVLDMDKG